MQVAGFLDNEDDRVVNVQIVAGIDKKMTNALITARDKKKKKTSSVNKAPDCTVDQVLIRLLETKIW